MTPYEDQLEFFSVLFARKTPQNLISVVVHAPGNEKAPVGPEIDRAFCASPQEAAVFASQYTTGKHVFFGVAPRGIADRKKSAVGEVITLWCDIDLPPAEAEQKLKRLLLPPTIMISSGRYVQAFWTLSTACPSIEKAEQVLKRLHLFLCGDEKTHDASRIMRVPGTQHVKDPSNPLPCRILTCDKENVYSLADMEAAMYLPETYRAMVLVPTEKGKRSEKDYRVIRKLLGMGMHETTALRILKNPDHPISAKIREESEKNATNPQHYLEFTLSKVKADMRLASDKSSSGLFEQRKDGIYYDGNRVATFNITPTRLVEWHKGGWFVCTIEAAGKVWHDFVLPRAAFKNDDNLSAAFPYLECQWTGTKKQAKNFQTWLLARATELGISTAQAVEAVGRHGDCFVSANQVLNLDGVVPIGQSDYLLADAGILDLVCPHSNWYIPPLDELRSFLTDFHSIYPRTNHPEVVWPVLAWYLTAPLKPELRRITGGFPLLNLFGSKGAGKTTVTETMRRLLSIYTLNKHKEKDDKGRDSTATKFAVIRNLTCSNALPMWLTEYLVSDADKGLNNLLKETWDNSPTQRGRSDMGVDNYDLSSPVSIDGNDPLAPSVEAIQERVIRVSMSPEWIARGTAANTFARQLTQLPLEHFAAPYLMYVLEQTHNVPHIYETAAALCEEAFADVRIPERIFKSVSMMTTGLIMYARFIYQAARITFEVTPDLLVSAFTPMLDTLLGNRGRVEVPADRFAEDIINEIYLSKENRSTVPFTYKYDPGDNVVRFNFKLSYSWWSLRCVQRGRDVPDANTLKQQLRERQMANEYALAPKVVRLNGQNAAAYTNGTKPHDSMYGLDIARMKIMGLDIPDDFATKFSTYSNGNGRLADVRNIR